MVWLILGACMLCSLETSCWYRFTECFGLEGTLKGHLVQAPAVSCDIFSWIRLLKAPFSPALTLIHSRDGASSTSGKPVPVLDHPCKLPCAVVLLSVVCDLPCYLKIKLVLAWSAVIFMSLGPLSFQMHEVLLAEASEDGVEAVVSSFWLAVVSNTDLSHVLQQFQASICLN